MILVGDSGGRFLLGHPDNNDVTMDEMILMTRSVCRGTEHALVIGDLPFMSYQVGIEDAIRNAGRLVKETRCNAVKLEGGAEFAPTVRALVQVGISVMAHTGLTPMTSAALGGYSGGAVLPEEQVWRDAEALQDAGAFSMYSDRRIAGHRHPREQRIAHPGDERRGRGRRLRRADRRGAGQPGLDAGADRPAAQSYGPVSRAVFEGGVRLGSRRARGQAGAGGPREGARGVAAQVVATRRRAEETDSWPRRPRRASLR